MELNTALDVIRKSFPRIRLSSLLTKVLIFYCVYREINKHGTYEVFTANEQVFKGHNFGGSEKFSEQNGRSG